MRVRHPLPSCQRAGGAVPAGVSVWGVSCGVCHVSDRMGVESGSEEDARCSVCIDQKGADILIRGRVCEHVPMSVSQPTLARTSLGQTLMRYRMEAGLSRPQVATRLGYSPQTMKRVEEGKTGVKQPMVQALCQLYEVPRQVMSHLCTLAIDGARRGWWQEYRNGAPPEIPLFLESEQEARGLRVLETEFIPGLLQTPEYLVAVQAAGLPIPDEAATAQRALRARRQELIYGRATPPELRFIIGAGALVYLSRQTAALRIGQVRRILEVSSLPQVEIRVIADLHAAMLGAFNVIEPGREDLKAFVYVDGPDGCRYIEDPSVVKLYESTYEAVWAASLQVEEYLNE